MRQRQEVQELPRPRLIPRARSSCRCITSAVPASGPVTDKEAATQLRKGAFDAQDRLSQEAYHAIKRDRSLTPLFERFVDEVLIPQAAAASFSDAMYEAAITSYLGWQRQRLLLGEERTSPALRRKLAQLEKLLDAAWKQVVKRADELRMRPGRHPIVGRLEFSKQWSDRGASLSETWELVHKPLRTPKQPTKRR